MTDRVEIDAEAIPDELQERDQWLFWNARSDRPRMPLADPDATRGWRDGSVKSEIGDWGGDEQ